MRYQFFCRIVPFLGGLLVFCVGSAGLAARPSTRLLDVKRSGAIVLGTLHNIRSVEQAVAGRENPISGFSFDFKLKEVLWGRVPESRPLHVSFSAAGYATNWEFGAKPAEGMKVRMYLRNRANIQKEQVKPEEIFPYGDHNGLQVLEAFDSEQVKTLRQSIGLWKLQTDEQRLEVIRQWLRSGNSSTAVLAVSVLNDLDGTWTGVELEEACSRSEALALLWKTYTSRETPPEAIWVCEGTFANNYRELGWETHPERYDVLYNAVKRFLAKTDQPRPYGHPLPLIALCSYPQQTGRTFQLLTDIIRHESKTHDWEAAIRLGLLYRAFTADPQLVEWNGRVLQKLEQLLKQSDPSISDGAAIALGNIAMQEAEWVALTDERQTELRMLAELAGTQQARSRLLANVTRAQAEQARSQDLIFSEAQRLGWPWSNQVGRKVVLRGNGLQRFRHDKVVVRLLSGLLWIDSRHEWPRNAFGRGAVFLQGKLSQVADVPVFVVQPGKPFGKGLPVSHERYRKPCQQRFVLTDAKWRFGKK